MVEDLSNQVFGRWTVVGWDHKDERNQNIWKCQCVCGNFGFVSTGVLKSGMSRSCGCLQAELLHERSYIDLTGQKYGKLTVIQRIGTDHHKTPIWECVCDCGNITYVPTNHLRSGHTQSCGCVLSLGEYSVMQFLKKHNIRYVPQKTFIGCVSNTYLKFDFWLPDYGLCIEFDGQHHYMDIDYFHNSLADVQRRDAIKTKYCEENDIVLLRIPYWEKQN